MSVLDEKKHISYSELSVWYKCSFQHYLKYIEKLSPFEDNIFTIFGRAEHSVAENALSENDIGDPVEWFSAEFKRMYEEACANGMERCDDTFDVFEPQGREIVPELVPALIKEFGNIKTLKCEHNIYSLLDGFKDFFFKGFIDFIFMDEKGTIYILDWKTCSWGWHPKKKSDKIKQYQLVYYKHFFCKEFGIDPSKVETYFGLLKRTAKKGQKVEFVRVTSGPKKTKNALDLAKKMVIDIAMERKSKNRKSCEDYCPFYKTDYCK